MTQSTTHHPFVLELFTRPPAFVGLDCVMEIARIIDECGEIIRNQLKEYAFHPQMAHASEKRFLHDRHGHRAGDFSFGFGVETHEGSALPEGLARFVIYDLGNPVFEKDGHVVLSKLLLESAQRIRRGETAFPVQDTNHSTIGFFEYNPLVAHQKGDAG
jgi:hypothetical protein